MKLHKLLFAAACAALVSSASANEIDDAFEALSENLTKIYPEAVTQLGTWSDAYIGKLVPSVPPHFGLGLSVAGTFIDTKEYSAAVNSIISSINSQVTAGGGSSGGAGAAINGTLGVKFDIVEKIPLPAYAVNARIGGIVLPFDIGLYGSYLAFNEMQYGNFSGGVKLWSAGGDLRFAVLQGSLALPKLSLGAGYIFSHMSLDASLSERYTAQINATASGAGSASISTSIPIQADISTNVNFNIHTFFAQAQLSKKFLIFIPYVGARAVVSVTQSGYDYKYSVVAEASLPSPATFPEIRDAGGHVYTNGFDLKNIQPQLYAGLGIDLFLFQLTAGGAWNPRNNLWSVNVNACFKM